MKNKQGVIKRIEKLLSTGFYTKEEVKNILNLTPSNVNTFKRQISGLKYEKDKKGIVMQRQILVSGKLMKDMIKYMVISK